MRHHPLLLLVALLFLCVSGDDIPSRPRVVSVYGNGSCTLHIVFDGYVLPADNSTIAMLGSTYHAVTRRPLAVIPPSRPLDAETIAFINPTAYAEGLITRIQVQRLRALSQGILVTVEYVGKYFNPSVVRWRGRLFLCSRLVTDSRVKRHFAENHIEFTWLNHSSAPLTETAYLGIPVNRLGEANRVLPGQDARVLVISDTKLLLTFTVSTHTPLISGKYMRTGKSELLVMHNELQVANNRSLIPIRYTKKNRHEKNWTPFQRDNRVLFIVTICPTLVVRPHTFIDKNPRNHRDIGARQFVKLVSNTTCPPYSWKYGELRGGTSAVLLGDRYVAVFHSVFRVPGSKMFTYFMGAYTFTKDPPYRLLQVSRVPIVDYKLYAGRTFNSWRRKTPNNYVVFPMSLFADGDDTLMLSLGTQDKKGWLCSVNTSVLLASLESL